MPHPNPWFLITGDEITTMEDSLHELSQNLPYTHQERLDGIIGVLSEVRERRL